MQVQTQLGPPEYAMGTSYAIPPVAMPGQYHFRVIDRARLNLRHERHRIQVAQGFKRDADA